MSSIAALSAAKQECGSSSALVVARWISWRSILNVLHVKIALGSDHAGYRYKEIVKILLAQLGHKVMAFEAYSDASCHYPDFIRPAAEAVAKGEVERGIVWRIRSSYTHGLSSTEFGDTNSANARNGASIRIGAPRHLGESLD